MASHLEEISLTGYKSIRHLQNFRMERGLNVLIGANGSGKTNFIRFFELLGHIFDSNKGLQNYIASRGRADAFLFRGMKTTPELTAHLKFDLNEYKFSLRTLRKIKYLILWSNAIVPFAVKFCSVYS